MENPYSPRRKTAVVQVEGKRRLSPFSRKMAASPMSRVNKKTLVAIHQRRCLLVSCSLSTTGVKALLRKRNILDVVWSER